MQALANGLSIGAIYSLVAICLALTVHSSRFVHFTIGALLAIGACIFYGVSKQLGWGTFAGMSAAISSGAVVGALTEWGVFRRLRARHSSGLVLMVASLGLLVMIEGVLALAFGRDPLVLRTGPIVPAISFGLIKVTSTQLLCIGSALAIATGLILTLRYTIAGKSLRAMANDRELAFSAGVPVGRITLAAFVTCGAVAAWTGVLVGLEQEATPGMGFRPLLMGVAGMVIGGQGRLFTAALGGLSMGVIQHLVGSFVPGTWQDAFVFAVLIIVLVLRPSGLFGHKLNFAGA